MATLAFLQKRNGSCHVTSPANYVKFEESEEDVKASFRVVAETVITFLANTEGEAGDEYCTFRERFFTHGSWVTWPFAFFGMKKWLRKSVKLELRLVV
jgi:hypothetical protein